MRYRSWVLAFMVVGLLIGPVHAESKDELKLIGVGAVISMSPYRGVGNRSMPVPLVVWDAGRFYMKGVEIGYKFYKDGALTLSAVTAPRFMGYSSDDSDALKGMEDKERSLDAGVKATVDLPWERSKVSLKVLGDVLTRSNGSEVELSVSREFSSRIWRLTPSIGARYQSADMIGYYYGVADGEIRPGRAAYDPESAVNGFANVMFNFGISEDWIVLTRVGAEVLSKEISESPIVSEDVLVTGIIGLARRF